MLRRRPPDLTRSHRRGGRAGGPVRPSDPPDFGLRSVEASMRMLRLALLTAVATGLLAVPALAADPTYVDEVVKVPTKYGRVWAEVHRPEGMGKVPIILTYSPYNTLNENGGNIADDSVAATFGPK